MITHLIEEIVVIFALAAMVVFLFQKAKMPSIVGFLATGVIAGPHGLGLITATENIEMVSEFGVVLLLFTIGIEFSLQSLIKNRYMLLMGGGLQVALTMFFAFIIFYAFGFPVNQSVCYGFICSLSSTAITLKVLQEKAEVNRPHGRVSLAILIFQDIMAVPMLLFIPYLVGGNSAQDIQWWSVLFKGAAIVGVTILLSRYLVPRFFYEIVRTQSQELFMFSVLVLVLSVAWFTSTLGLSLALGAFLAGLIISESEYGHHAFGNIIPLRDILTSVFFVSIGMLLNLSFFISNPILVLSITLMVMILKTLIAGFAAYMLGLPFKSAVAVGLTISQIGEFSFILSKAGVSSGLFDPFHYQLFLDVTVLTLALTPGVIALSPKISDFAARLPLSALARRGFGKKEEILVDPKIDKHLLIIGMGINGFNVARAAKYAGIAYTMIDFDADRVKEFREKGEPIVFGDAANEQVLRHAKADRAEVAVVLVGESKATFRIVEAFREINHNACLIVRTRQLRDVEMIYNLGASEVVPEEFETSIEIFSRVLSKYMIPREEIDQQVAELRADGYEVLRTMKLDMPHVSEIQRHIPDFQVATFKVQMGSLAAAKEVFEIGFRRTHGVSLVAIRRGAEIITVPKSHDSLLVGDMVYILGTSAQIAAISALFRNPNQPQTVFHHQPSEE